MLTRKVRDVAAEIGREEKIFVEKSISVSILKKPNANSPWLTDSKSSGMGECSRRTVPDSSSRAGLSEKRNQEQRNCCPPHVEGIWTLRGREIALAVWPSRLGADKIGRIIDASVALVPCHLRIGAEGPRAINLAVRDVRGDDIPRSSAAFHPLHEWLQ